MRTIHIASQKPLYHVAPLDAQINDALRTGFDSANAAGLLPELFGKIRAVVADISKTANPEQKADLEKLAADLRQGKF